MQKKSLLALLLALVMILSGCSLVTVDEVKDNARVIVDVNGETVNKQTIKSLVANTLSQNQYYNQLYASYGMSAAFPTDEATVTQQVIDSFVNNLVAKQKAAKMGFDQLTEEETSQVESVAKDHYDSFIESVVETYLPGTELEGDELTKAAEQYVKDNDVKTANGYATLEDFIKAESVNKSIEKLQADAIKDVAVTEEEIVASYNDKVEAAKAAVEENPDQYGYNLMNGTPVYYAPAGYRMVKHILVPIPTEDNSKITELTTALNTAKSAQTAAQEELDAAAEDADKEALQAKVDEANAAVEEAQKALDEATAQGMANAKAKADEVYALATAEGADFDALIAEYSSDTMPSEGYAIREGYSYFVEPFVTAAMALETVGQISEPVESTYGYHIIQYVSDVAEGPVDMETVRAAIESEVLTTKQDEALAAAMESWKSEFEVKTFTDKMN